jgi:SNF family Na+-dependent transporter
MDFTYPTAFVLAAMLSFLISLTALLISILSKRSVPRRYPAYITILIVFFVVAVSLRWSDWKNILLTAFGLMDLAIISAFAAMGALAGAFPIWLFGQRRSAA